jgi:hypothetical protein
MRAFGSAKCEQLMIWDQRELVQELSSGRKHERCPTGFWKSDKQTHRPFVVLFCLIQEFAFYFERKGMCRVKDARLNVGARVLYYLRGSECFLRNEKFGKCYDVGGITDARIDFDAKHSEGHDSG